MTLVYTLQGVLTQQVVGGFVWNGTEFVILVRAKGTSLLLRIDTDGKVQGEPVDVGGPNGYIAWNGKELGVLHDAPPVSNFAIKAMLQSCQRFSPEGDKPGGVVAIDKGPFEMGSGGIVAWQCGYLVMLPGVADHPPEEPALDSSRIVRIRDDGAVEDVPLPPGGPDISPRLRVRLDLQVYWGDVEFTTGDLYFPTRWFAPYQKSGRMRVSCGK